MTKITVQIPHNFTLNQLLIIQATFEKLSQLTTLYKDAKLSQPMKDCVSVQKDDINWVDVFGFNNTQEHSFSVSDFIVAIQQALHTIVTFEFSTSSGVKTISKQLMPCIINEDYSVTWDVEPDFIFNVDEDCNLSFKLFGELADLAIQGTNPNKCITKLVFKD